MKIISHRYISLVSLLITATVLLGCTNTMLSIGVQSIQATPYILPLAAGQSTGEGTTNYRIEQRGINKITLDKDKISSVRSIALLTIPNPPYFMYATLSRTVPTTFFDSDQSVTYSTQATANEADLYETFDVSKIITQKVIARLEEEGYKVIPVSVNRKEPYKLLSDYQPVEVPDFDAFIDLVPVKIGYMWHA